MPRRLRIGYPRAYRVSGDSGTYTLTGQAASILATRRITADSGTYSVSGQDATLSGGSAGSGDVPSQTPLPSGSLSFTVQWADGDGEAGYVIYVSTSSQTYPDPSLYAYRYLAASGSSSLLISNVQSGTKYVRVAAHQSNYVGDLGHEVSYTPA